MRGSITTLIGADGSGKTTLARQLQSALGERATYIYMGSNPSAMTHALPLTRMWTWLKRQLGRDVHQSGPPSRSSRTGTPARVTRRIALHLKSLIVMSLAVADDAYRLTLAALLSWLGYRVILDRHPYADFHYRRVGHVDGWQRWGDRIHSYVLRLYPRPSGLVFLDAPAILLHRRKPEGSLSDLAVRCEEYRAMVSASDDVRVLDASRPVEELLSRLLDGVRVASEDIGSRDAPGGGDDYAGPSAPRS